MWPPPKPPTRFLTWTLCIVAADAEVSGSDDAGVVYGRAKNILISHNRFDHNAGRIVLGGPTPSLSNLQLMPCNIWIEHNTFAGDGKGTESSTTWRQANR